MKKMKIQNIGLRKKTTGILWTLLIGSVLFGVYKNLTAIDQHTVHEEKIIETKIVDTNMISSYVTDFAQEYFSWEPTKENLEARTERLKRYFNDDLQSLNAEMIRSDIPTSSVVEKVKIWKIDSSSDTIFDVHFSVIQRISEGEVTNVIESAYSIPVATNNSNMISIAANPRIDTLPEKMNLKNEVLQDDISVNQQDKEEIKEFLSTFFKIYPTASRTELLYYVDAKTINEINKDYIFDDIRSINYFSKNNSIEVLLTVKYLDNTTKTSLFSQYQVLIESKNGKWVIVDGI